MKMRFLTEAFDLIAPRECAICSQRLTATESVICGECHLRLPQTNFLQKPYDNPMARLFWGVLPIEKAVAYFYYIPHAQSSQMIHHLKYHHQPEVGEYMGQIIAKALKQHRFFEDIDAIVPIPITSERKRERGYNQSIEIARGISEVAQLSILSKAVWRTQFDDSQTKKRGWERQENVEGAFQLVKPDAVKGKHLLVVDDIVTTGATIKACAQELCKAGDVRISVVALGFTKS